MTSTEELCKRYNDALAECDLAGVSVRHIEDAGNAIVARLRELEKRLEELFEMNDLKIWQDTLSDGVLCRDCEWRISWELETDCTLSVETCHNCPGVDAAHNSGPMPRPEE